MKHPTNKEMVEKARAEYQKGGEIEIDDGAKVSRSRRNENKGAYVQAWVWVYDGQEEAE